MVDTAEIFCHNSSPYGLLPLSLIENQQTDSSKAGPKSPLAAITEEYLLDLLGSIEHVSSSDIAGALSYTDLVDSDFYVDMRRNDAPSIVARLLHQFNRLTGCHTAIDFMLQVVRHRILLLNLVLWEWLEHEIKDSYQNYSHWLRPLRFCVQGLLNSQPRTSTELRVDDFITGLSPAVPIYRHTAHVNRHYDLESSPTRLQDEETLLEKILIQWFDFPSEPNFRSRALLVREIVDSIGCDALFLQPVWQIGSSVSWVLFKNIPRNPTRADLRKWASSEFCHYALAQTGSKSRDILSQIGRHFGKLSPGEKALSSWVVKEFSSPSCAPSPRNALVLPDEA